MIKVNELRVGNLIAMPIDSGKHYWKVLEIRENGIIYGIDLESGTAFCKLDVPNPIPLTPEWLERCGFVNIGTDQLGGWHNYRKEMPELHSVSIWYNGINCFQFTYDGSVKFIHHLHQLQNLYLALTGEELTINHEHLQSTS